MSEREDEEAVETQELKELLREGPLVEGLLNELLDNDLRLTLEEEDEMRRLLLLLLLLLLETLLDDRLDDLLEELLGRLLDDLDEDVPDEDDWELLPLADDEEPPLREDREL